MITIKLKFVKVNEDITYGTLYLKLADVSYCPNLSRTHITA